MFVGGLSGFVLDNTIPGQPEFSETFVFPIVSWFMLKFNDVVVAYALAVYICIVAGLQISFAL